MKHLYRIIFWGIVCLIVLFLGIYGVIINNSLFSSRKDELNSIVRNFNTSSLLNNYKNSNIEVSAKIEGKDITVYYSGINKSEYKFILHKDYIETHYDYNDSFGQVMVMIMSTSINKYLGYDENINSLFRNNNLAGYKLRDGIEFGNKKNYVYAKLSLDKPLLNKIKDDNKNTLDN